MHAASDTLPPAAAGWQARLSLVFTRAADRTVLSSRHHVGPLLVQRPFYPEGDVCHVYLVHPPGGIVGGDQLALAVTAEPGSHALLTTPAATKFYRAAPGRVAVLAQALQARSATLEWLPQESLFFDSTAARVSTRVHLDAQSRFIGWELSCFGRPAGAQLFAAGSLRQSFQLYCDDRPLLLDRLRIDSESGVLQAPWGLANHTALGTLIAFPATPADLEAARALGDADSGLACSLVDRVLICRVLKPQGEEAKLLLLQVWRCLRPRLLGREPVAPRIWAT